MARSQVAEAKSVFIFESDAYVAGFESNGTKGIPTLWKNGVDQNITDGIQNA